MDCFEEQEDWKQQPNLPPSYRLLLLPPIFSFAPFLGGLMATPAASAPFLPPLGEQTLGSLSASVNEVDVHKTIHWRFQGVRDCFMLLTAKMSGVHAGCTVLVQADLDLFLVW